MTLQKFNQHNDLTCVEYFWCVKAEFLKTHEWNFCWRIYK